MHSFNLVSAPWIPVYRTSAGNGLVSLSEVFTDKSIVDLNADPCERIALMRVLMAIAHRANDLSVPAPQYLDAWKSSFDLGDENSGFLRLPGVTAAEVPTTPSPEYLQFHRGYKLAHLTLEQIALGILTFQCCYLGGLCARNLSVDGKAIARVSAECSPSMEGGPLYSFIIGSTLLDTLALNFLPKGTINGEMGVPVWESFSTNTFLGRMLPISYSIAFSSGFKCMSYGPTPYSYQNQTQDPWLAYRSDRKGGSVVVRINSEKALWRELPAITAIPEPGQRGGSLLLQQSRNLSGAQVWVGGLAKLRSDILTLVESRFDLSGEVLENLRVEGYLSAFTGAEEMARRLVKAVKLHLPWANPGDASMRYWNRLDSSKNILFDLMAGGADPAPWSAHCLQTARRVLTEVGDATTAREYRALTIAQAKLK
jgi:hypothetical protein